MVLLQLTTTEDYLEAINSTPVNMSLAAYLAQDTENRAINNDCTCAYPDMIDNTASDGDVFHFTSMGAKTAEETNIFFPRPK